MSTVVVGQENSAPIELYFEDHGVGPAVVLLHGWPLDSRSWEPQLHPLLDAGYRVILYDRRGFGRSSRPTEGYDFDTLAGDLDTGAGRSSTCATRPWSASRSGPVSSPATSAPTAPSGCAACVFIESLAPSFAKSAENPEGVDAAGVAGVQQAILDDRYAWLTGLLGDFLNLDEYLGQTRQRGHGPRDVERGRGGLAAYATWACPPGWLDDFSEDIKRIDVPTLILHGTADRILPIEGQGRRLHAALPEARYVEIEGGPHIGCVTHAEEINRELLRSCADAGR